MKNPRKDENGSIILLEYKESWEKGKTDALKRKLLNRQKEIRERVFRRLILSRPSILLRLYFRATKPWSLFVTFRTFCPQLWRPTSEEVLDCCSVTQCGWQNRLCSNTEGHTCSYPTVHNQSIFSWASLCFLPLTSIPSPLWGL